jgi:hypothetical protein
MAWWHDPKGAEWTEGVCAGRSALGMPRASELEGRNSFVEPRRDELTQALDVTSAAMRAPGTRVVFQVRRGDANARRQLANVSGASSWFGGR